MKSGGNVFGGCCGCIVVELGCEPPGEFEKSWNAPGLALSMGIGASWLSSSIGLLASKLDATSLVVLKCYRK